MKKIVVLAMIIGLALTLSIPLHAQDMGEGVTALLSGFGTVKRVDTGDASGLSLMAVYRDIKPHTLPGVRHGGHLQIGTDVNCTILISPKSGVVSCDDHPGAKYNFNCLEPGAEYISSAVVYPGKPDDETRIEITRGSKELVYILVDGFIECSVPGM